MHPAFKSGELSMKGDPYGGYTGGEQVMLAYLQKNPELANKAAGAAATFAASHPQQAMQMASAVGTASSNANAKPAAEANPWSG